MPTTTVDKITALLEQENPDAPFFVYHDAIKQIRDEVANMSPNGGSQTVAYKKRTVAYADFSDVDGQILSSVFYSLQPGEVLLGAQMRVTEAFDDTGGPAFAIVDETNSINLGGSFTDVGPALPVATAGLVFLEDTGTVSSSWSLMLQPATPETAAVGLILFATGMNFDGATGSLDVYLLIGTPA